jgi:hypothetical protein
MLCFNATLLATVSVWWDSTLQRGHPRQDCSACESPSRLGTGGLLQAALRCGGAPRQPCSLLPWLAGGQHTSVMCSKVVSQHHRSLTKMGHFQAHCTLGRLCPPLQGVGCMVCRPTPQDTAGKPCTVHHFQKLGLESGP